MSGAGYSKRVSNITENRRQGKKQYIYRILLDASIYLKESGSFSSSGVFFVYSSDGVSVEEALTMRRLVWYILRIILLCVFAFALSCAYVPLTFKAARVMHRQPAPVGPKAYYLALGDSLAFGYQPDFDWTDGYANYFFGDLKTHGGQHYDNLSCPGESSVSMVNGGCPYALLHKYAYAGAQLQAAVNYLHTHAGQVSPVTLDIGANDLIPNLDTARCTINAGWASDLARVDANLKNVILPQLIAAMTVNGQMSGDLLLLNYYDPYQNICPNTIPEIQAFNQDLATDAGDHAILVDVASAFHRPATETTSLTTSSVCMYTWMCSKFKNIHPNKMGYAIIASAIERAVGY